VGTGCRCWEGGRGRRAYGVVEVGIRGLGDWKIDITG